MLIDHHNFIWLAGYLSEESDDVLHPYVWKMNMYGDWLATIIETSKSVGYEIKTDFNNNFYLLGGFTDSSTFGDTTIYSYQEANFIAKFQNSMPLADFTSFGPTCEKQEVNFQNSSVKAQSVSWEFPGGIPQFSTSDSSVNIFYSFPGNYAIKLIAKNAGYSDTILKTLTVYPVPFVTVNLNDITVCLGDTVTLMGQGAYTYTWSDSIINGQSFILTQTNIYTVIGTDTNNCSDTSSITITVNPLPDVSLSSDGTTLTANQAQADYQWRNCDDGFSEISEATYQSYTAVENGNYAVIIDLDGCVDTSQCVAINNVSLVDLADGVGWIKVFPSPSSGKFTIQSSQPISSITITNLIGEKIYSSMFSIQDSKLEIDISYHPPGIYFLEIGTNGKREMKKIKLQ